MKRGLVHRSTLENGRAVAVVRQAPHVQASGPTRVEMPAKADLVSLGFGLIRQSGRWFTHSALGLWCVCEHLVRECTCEGGFGEHASPKLVSGRTFYW